MNDLISRQAVEDLIMETDPWECEGTARAILEGVKRLPTAQQEQTAEWVPSTKYKGFLTCSACEDCYIEGWSDKERKWRYCPQCGKRMR